MNKKTKRAFSSLRLIRNLVSSEIQKTGTSGLCPEVPNVSGTKRVKWFPSCVRSFPVNNTSAAPKAPGMAQCLHFFLSFPALILLATPAHGSPSVLTKGAQSLHKEVLLHWCITSPAEERSCTSRAPMERLPNPACLALSCFLQLGCCPASPAASTNVTLYPQPPTRLSGRQPPSKKLISFYQVFPNSLPDHLSLISEDAEVWEGWSYSEPRPRCAPEVDKISLLQISSFWTLKFEGGFTGHRKIFVVFSLVSRLLEWR